jgi:hypothetical protein
MQLQGRSKIEYQVCWLGALPCNRFRRTRGIGKDKYRETLPFAFPFTGAAGFDRQVICKHPGGG